MTEAEAQEMLAALKKHYREPVMPVSSYCDALNKWCEVAGDEAISHLFHITIPKSNLLARLIYGGEKLRTVQCPTHKGKWSGCKPPGTCACQCGIDVTGWLPE